MARETTSLELGALWAPTLERRCYGMFQTHNTQPTRRPPEGSIENQFTREKNIGTFNPSWTGSFSLTYTRVGFRDTLWRRIMVPASAIRKVGDRMSHRSSYSHVSLGQERISMHKKNPR